MNYWTESPQKSSTDTKTNKNFLITIGTNKKSYRSSYLLFSYFEIFAPLCGKTNLLGVRMNYWTESSQKSSTDTKTNKNFLITIGTNKKSYRANDRSSYLLFSYFD